MVTQPIEFGSNLELNQHQILNPVFHKLTALPEGIVEGQYYYNTTTKYMCYWNGTSIVTVGEKYDLPPATTTTLGGVIVPVAGHITVAADGTIAVVEATTSDKGVIQIATGEEVTAGEDTAKAITPATLKQQTDLLIPLAQKGVANGVAELGNDGKVPTAQLPSYVDDVIEAYTREGTTPLAADWLSLTEGGEALTPETGKIYVVLSEGDYKNKTLRWGGSTYVLISEFPDVDGTTIVYNDNNKLHTNIDNDTIVYSSVTEEVVISNDCVISPMVDCSLTDATYNPQYSTYSYNGADFYLFVRANGATSHSDKTIIDTTKGAYCSWNTNGAQCVLKSGTPIYVKIDTTTGLPLNYASLSYEDVKNNTSGAIVTVGNVGDDTFAYVNPVTSETVTIATGMSSISFFGKAFVGTAWAQNDDSDFALGGSCCVTNITGYVDLGNNGYAVKTTEWQTVSKVKVDTQALTVADKNSGAKGIVNPTGGNTEVISGNIWIKDNSLTSNVIMSTYKDHNSMLDATDGTLFAMADGIKASFDAYDPAVRTLTNKTIDADDNTISDLALSNFASGKVSLATDELQQDAIAPSLAKVTSMITTSKAKVDNVTVDYNASDELEVKDNGLTPVKIADSSMALGSTELKANAIIPSKLAVDEAIVAERSANATLTNHTINARNTVVGSKATNTLAFNDASNFTAGDTITIGSTVFTAGTDFVIGATHNDTIDNIVASCLLDDFVLSAGTTYATHDLVLTAKQTGTAYNGVACDTTKSLAAWENATTQGGSDDAVNYDNTITNLYFGNVADNAMKIAWGQETTDTAKFISEKAVALAIETERQTEATLTNKTINTDNNTLSNIRPANFDSARLSLLDGESASTAQLTSLEKVQSMISEASVPDATTTVKGKVALGTQEDIATGTDDKKATTPKAVHDYVAAELTTALRYRGTWTTTAETTDYSALNDMRPMKQGDMFLVAGTGCTIDDVEYRPGDHIIFNKACSASTTIVTAMIDKVDSTESADIVRLNATQTLTNKTIDADNNSIVDLKMTNLASANAAFADSESTAELKASAQVPSLKKVEALISASEDLVDNVTIDRDADSKLEVKDNGLTVSKVADGSLVKGTDEVKADGKLMTQVAIESKINSDIVAERSASATLTNKTINADNNTLSNIETDNFKEGVVVDSTTGISASSTASDEKIATEKAIATFTENSITTERSATATLTNKTINVDNNTLSNVEVDNFKDGVVVDSTTGISQPSSASDDKFVTEKAVSSYVDGIAIKLVEETNPALTITGGEWSWEITDAGNAISVMVLDADGYVFKTTIRCTSTSVIISGVDTEGRSTIPADTYTVRILK